MDSGPSLQTPPPRHFNSDSAFTLIEMMIVLAIIALLIGVLLPTLGVARRYSQASLCQSNLRQWGIAVNDFATDNEDYLPRRGQGVQATTQLTRPEDWFNSLPPLMSMESYMQRVAEGRPPASGESSIWACPAAAAPVSGNFFAYGMNMRLSTWNAVQADRIDYVAPISAQVFMADGPGTHCSVLPSSLDYSPMARHDGRVSIVFLDGHGVLLTGDYVGCGVGDPMRPDVEWFVLGSPWPGP